MAAILLDPNVLTIYCVYFNIQTFDEMSMYNVTNKYMNCGVWHVYWG